MCLGPRPSLQWVTERCPRNARLEWTTAKVKSNRANSVMDFDIRCVECAKEYALYELLQSQGILANSDDDRRIPGVVGFYFLFFYKPRST